MNAVESAKTPLADEGVALVWRSHAPALVRYLAKRLGCTATAEDLVQDTYLRLARAPPLAAIENPRAFLYRIALNLARDHARQAARRHVLLTSARSLLEADEDQAGAERQLIAGETLARVTAAVARLPERTRLIFTLNRFEGFSQREIAEQLRISTTAVEKHVRRALAVLAEAADPPSLDQ
jgi:RNA polymerase sigma factor (sigma-70 family)